MSIPEHLAMLRRGVEAWNHWHLHERPLVLARPSPIYGQGPDLSGADLQQAMLAGINFSATNLRGANLSQADVHGADLGLADLRGAILQGANLCQSSLAADLRGADLREARLAGADLRGSWLNAQTRLEGVLLQDAEHGSARVAGLDWSQVRLAAIAWEQVDLLGDEEILSALHTRKEEPGASYELLQEYERLWQYESAIQAYETLHQALKEQGLSAQAARFRARARSLRENPEYRFFSRRSWRQQGRQRFFPL
jgi:hypothetical protein